MSVIIIVFSCALSWAGIVNLERTAYDSILAQGQEIQGEEAR